MKTYKFIYWNNKEYHFFNVENEKDAYQKVVNTFDLSFEPNFFKIESENERSFEIKANLSVLGLKKHFRLNWVGENLFSFLKK